MCDMACTILLLFTIGAIYQLTGVRAADHPTAPVEALHDGAGKVVYGKEAVQAFADHLAQVYEKGHQVPEDLIADIPSMPAALGMAA